MARSKHRHSSSGPPPLPSASSFHSVRDVSAAASPLPNALPLNDDGLWDRPLRVLLTSASHGGASLLGLRPHSPDSSPAPSALARGQGKVGGTKSPIGFNSDITKHHDAERRRRRDGSAEDVPTRPLSCQIDPEEARRWRTTHGPRSQVTSKKTDAQMYFLESPAVQQPVAAQLGPCVPVYRESDSCEACANCGKQGNDIVKLKSCTACRLVKYCGVDCQRAHRKQHKKACRQRAAELKDEQLYSQGHERPEGDFCPICTLPIPLPMGDHSVFNVCCMKGFATA
ncbi:hypothetical protein THAOC_27420, partial [Thalassiosira oceanica]